MFLTFWFWFITYSSWYENWGCYIKSLIKITIRCKVKMAVDVDFTFISKISDNLNIKIFERNWNQKNKNSQNPLDHNISLLVKIWEITLKSLFLFYFDRSSFTHFHSYKTTDQSKSRRINRTNCIKLDFYHCNGEFVVGVKSSKHFWSTFF